MIYTIALNQIHSKQPLQNINPKQATLLFIVTGILKNSNNREWTERAYVTSVTNRLNIQYFKKYVHNLHPYIWHCREIHVS